MEESEHTIARITLCYLGLFVLAFIYLAAHTLVGLDEVMLLDPCHRWINGQGYTSKLWYAPGTEDRFMAYLPVTSMLRSFFLLILPDTLFFHRLPFILVYFSCAILLYQITFKRSRNITISYLTLLFFISDKGLWDAALSGRSEIIQALLIMLFFYFESKQNSNRYVVIKGLITGLLLLTHPPAWILVPVFLYFNIRKGGGKDAILFIFSLGIPLLLYLATINFNVSEMLVQLFTDGSTEEAKHTMIYRILHIYQRFLPYPYLNEPWVIGLILAILYLLVNRKIPKDNFNKKAGIAFISYFLFIAVASENYYRYNPPLLVCSYLLLPLVINHFLTWLKADFNSMMFAFTVLVLVSPFFYRMYKVLDAASVNNTTTLATEVRRTIRMESAGNNNLLIGEPLGFYAALNQPGLNYCTSFTAHKFNLKYYHTIFVLSYAFLPLSEYELVKEFVPGASTDGTYLGLKLYRKISNNEELVLTHQFFREFISLRLK